MAKQEQPKDSPAVSGDGSAAAAFEISIDIDADEPGPEEQAAFMTATPPAGIPVPRERSGAISIGGGDFATPAPMPRKRRTTQPRGVPVESATDGNARRTTEPLASGTEADAANGTSPLVAPAFDEPTPPPSEITLTTGMALPPRPLPEDRAPTPAPERLARSVVDTAVLPSAEFETPTPPPELVVPPPTLVVEPPVPVPRKTPLPRKTPAPAPAVALQAESVAPPPPRFTPPPQMLTPPPVAVSPPASTSLARAETPVPRPPAPPAVESPPPASAFDPADAGAVPARPMPEMDSGSNMTPLAQTLAHMAEAARSTEPGGHQEGDVSADDDVELVDAPIGSPPAVVAAPPVAPRKSVPPPPPVVASPPPLPGTRTRVPPELLSALPVPEALSPRPRRPKRSKPWYEEVFDEDYLRTLPFISSEQTVKEARFIESSLEAAVGAELLDVGCGYGRHAVELSVRGYKVTGLDLSLPLLICAADESQRRAVSVNFVHADMRELAFDRQFDGAYCMLTSFGYFDEDANLKVAEGIARALKPGARFLLDVVNRDYVVADLPTRVWWEGSGCVVLEEVDFNFHTSRLTSRRSVVFDDGRQLEQEISIRAYGLHELGRLLRQAGFRVLDISGSFATRGHFFGGASRNLLLLAEKRAVDH